MISRSRIEKHHKSGLLGKIDSCCGVFRGFSTGECVVLFLEQKEDCKLGYIPVLLWAAVRHAVTAAIVKKSDYSLEEAKKSWAHKNASLGAVQVWSHIDHRIDDEKLRWNKCEPSSENPIQSWCCAIDQLAINGCSFFERQSKWFALDGSGLKNTVKE